MTKDATALEQANTLLKADYDFLVDILTSDDFKDQGGKQIKNRSKSTIKHAQIFFDIVNDKLGDNAVAIAEHEATEAGDSRVEAYDSLTMTQKEAIYLALCAGKDEIEGPKKHDTGADITKKRKAATSSASNKGKGKSKS